MTANRAKPRELTKRGAAARKRIVDAAANLVYERGVAGASLDDVMEASGTSKSQIYHYFTDKDALIREVIALQTERVLAAQMPRLEQLDSLTALRSWGNSLIQINRATHSGRCPIGALAHELVSQSEKARRLLAGSFERWELYVENGLAAMKERGVLRPGANPEELAVAVISALQGGMLLSHTARSSRPLELALEMALGHVARHLAGQRLPARARRPSRP